MDEPDRIAKEIRLEVREGQTLRVEKVVALFTSRDRGIAEAGVAARLAMSDAPGFEALRQTHRAAWARLWRRCDVEVDTEPDPDLAVHDQLVLRLHIFHLLQTASPHTAGRDVGIPARGLHGEAYRGHVFWDELFILPFYVQRLPALARSVIRYRYYRLDAARKLARQAGCAGAAFPWQSGSDGREATQELHLNPLSGRWDPDYSHLQRHVNSAIVYNVWRYYEATADRAFLEAYGAEIVLEIARFWSSLARWNLTTGRYDITGVMGPDEYHEKYPDAASGGLRNNAYTNLTAVWCLLRALDVLDAISRERREELLQLLAIDDAELQRWDVISRHMAVAFHDGVISQFEGYGDLAELDWAGYTKRYGRIERLDRLLRAEGTSTDRFKVSKQADLVMLLYLFSSEELTATPRAARLRVRRRGHPPERAVLPGAHFPRLDAEQGGPHLGGAPRGLRGGLQAVPLGAPQRPLRRAGRHHRRGRAPGRDGGDGGHRHAALRRDGAPPRRGAPLAGDAAADAPAALPRPAPRPLVRGLRSRRRGCGSRSTTPSRASCGSTSRASRTCSPPDRRSRWSSCPGRRRCAGRAPSPERRGCSSTRIVSPGRRRSRAASASVESLAECPRLARDRRPDRLLSTRTGRARSPSTRSLLGTKANPLSGPGARDPTSGSRDPEPPLPCRARTRPPRRGLR